MHTNKLRKVGGSVMLAVPPALFDQLQIQSGSPVGLGVDRDRLVVQPLVKPHYTLAELLANSEYSEVPSQQDRDWVDSAAVGKEL